MLWPRRTDGRMDLLHAQLDVLARLQATLGRSLDREPARRRLESRSAGEPWPQALLAVGRELGLDVEVHTSSLAELVRGSLDTSLPVVTVVEGSAGARAIAVLERRGRKLVVSDLEGKRTLGLAAAQALFGADDEALSWVSAVPLLPLGEPDGEGLSHAEHAHQPETPRRTLARLVRLERADVGVTVVYAAGVGLLSLVIPVGVQMIVNTVAFGRLVQPLVVLSILVFGGLVLAAALRALQAWVVERVQQRAMVRVALDLAHRLPRLRPEAAAHVDPASLANWFFEAVTVQKGSAVLLLDGVTMALQALVGLLVLAFYHPVLLAFDVLLVGSMILIVVGLGRGGAPTAIAESKRKHDLGAWLDELARNPTTFKLHEGPALAMARAEDLVGGWLSARRRHFSVLFRQTVGTLAVQVLASTSLLAIGGWLVIERQLSLGQLVAAELLVTAVVASFGKLGKVLEAVYDLVGASDKLVHLAALPLEPISHGHSPAAGAAGVVLHGIALSSPFGEPLLEGIDLDVPAGSRVGIVGPSGSGKSALLQVLAGLEVPRAGRVQLDGREVRGLLEERASVALVRGAEVFAGTIAENVRVGRRDISSEAVRSALEMVGLLDEVAALPAGIDTPLETGGAPLSRGQVERLVTARALVGRPRLLLLDQPLAALPAAVRASLLERLAGPEAPWTLVVVAPDREALPEVDRLYELGGGSLRLVSTRASLVQR